MTSASHQNGNSQIVIANIENVADDWEDVEEGDNNPNQRDPSSPVNVRRDIRVDQQPQ